MYKFIFKLLNICVCLLYQRMMYYAAVRDLAKEQLETATNAVKTLEERGGLSRWQRSNLKVERRICELSRREIRTASQQVTRYYRAYNALQPIVKELEKYV